MKSIKYLVIPVIVLCLLLTACKGKTPSDAADTSEQAMENFLRKLDEGNYTMNVEGYLKTTAYSRDLVYFDYAEEHYNDLTVMSVNNETFQAVLRDDGLENVRFVMEGQAIDAAKEKLVSAWVDLSQGNIYNFFYNSQEEPLKFVSYDDMLKDNVRALVGNPETSLRLMHEVYLVLDKEDPSVVHIQAEVDDDVVARMSYDDIDIVITFGEAQDNEVSEAWMKDPTYPAARTGWTEEDYFIFNSVFLSGADEEVIPFPTFASYAMTNDGKDFYLTEEVKIRDSHASEANVKDYVAALLADGFKETKEKAEDGTEETWYRRLLREEYQCYTSVKVDYDDGMNLLAKKYYDFPIYEDLSSANEVIKANGFPELPASDKISAVRATDRASEAIESWLYFFDYDTVLYVDIPFEDENEIRSYLNDYNEVLLNANFHSTTEDEGEEEVVNLMQLADKPVNLKGQLGLEADEIMESANGLENFRYHFDDGKVTLLFKAQHYISAEEAAQLIVAAGFPAVTFKNDDTFSSRDLKKFEKAMYGKDVKAFVTANQVFADTTEAEAFLNQLEASLNAAGFDRANPSVVGTLKQIAIVNEEAGMLVGIDLIEQADGTAAVYLDFEAD
ncbi:MAG: hypothetical protein IKG39_05655 [Lachnospiraceae bacterium]|nr:hypothetical protein [Lachnospiraceae bacterium]